MNVAEIALQTQRGIMVLLTGFIDEQGKIVIQPKLSPAGSFREGLASVGAGGVGYINKTGRMVLDLPDEFNGGGPFSEGLALVSKKNFPSYDLRGFINKKGEVVISPRFTMASKFSEGIATFNIGGSWPNGGPISGGEWGILDKQGNVVTTLTAIAVPGHPSDGLVPVTLDVGWTSWQYLDLSNNPVIPGPFEWADSFSENLAAVKVNGLYGYIDKKGTWIIQPRFEASRAFSQGLAAVTVDGKWGYINPKGDFEIKPRFVYAESFLEKFAAVQFSADEAGLEQKWGYIDKAGQPKFTVPNAIKAQSFSEGLASFDVAEEISFEKTWPQVAPEYNWRNS